VRHTCASHIQHSYHRSLLLVARSQSFRSCITEQDCDSEENTVLRQTATRRRGKRGALSAFQTVSTSRLLRTSASTFSLTSNYSCRADSRKTTVTANSVHASVNPSTSTLWLLSTRRHKLCINLAILWLLSTRRHQLCVNPSIFTTHIIRSITPAR